MKRSILQGCLLPVFLFLASGEGMVRLKDGSFIFGEVVSHDESGILVRRVDNGGQVNLKWAHLFPAEENALRLKYGYKDQSGEEVLVEVDRLQLDDGTERRGLIVDRSSSDIYIKIKDSIVPIPKSRVKAPADRVQVNALDVYTKDQLYDMKLAELNPQNAQGYLDLARFLVRIRDLRRALDSYKKVQALDSSFHSDEVTGSVNRLEGQAAKQDEIDWIDSIDLQRGRGSYAKALELCQTFLQKWPQSSFLNDIQRKKQKIEKERDEFVLKKVVLAWYSAAERLAGKAGSTREMALAEAQSYAEKQMGKDIQLKVAEEIRKIQPEITPELVRSLWEKRGKLASVHRSTYGDGTFILGAEKAQKGCVDDKEEKKDKSNVSAAEKELQDRVKKYIEQYQRAVKGGSGTQGSEEEAGEDWWYKARSSERQQWILSYYSEFGGDMTMTKSFCDLCQTCAGSGTITTINTANDSNAPAGNQANPGTIQTPCPSCHKVRVRRNLYYK